MASNPVTKNAHRCEDCSLTSTTSTDPVRVLERLPKSLFRHDEPTGEGIFGAEFDEGVILDQALIGVVPPEGVTPQYELARVFAQEKDYFRLGWEKAKALQHGLGLMALKEDGTTVAGDCPRAAGAELDRVGEQYGIGRPPGFTDCCYWRFLVLALFTPGPTLWRVVEVAELFTGLRPQVSEEPAKLVLTWPSLAGTTFFDHEGYFDDSAFFNSDDIPPQPAQPLDGFWLSGSGNTVETFWGRALPGGPPAIGLGEAIELVKPAGVFVELQNLPPLGATGCLGATKRGGQAQRGVWA